MNNVTLETYDAPAPIKREIIYQEMVETSYWQRFKWACYVFWKIMFLGRKPPTKAQGISDLVRASILPKADRWYEPR